MIGCLRSLQQLGERKHFLDQWLSASLESAYLPNTKRPPTETASECHQMYAIRTTTVVRTITPIDMAATCIQLISSCVLTTKRHLPSLERTEATKIGAAQVPRSCSVRSWPPSAVS
jgi:hypothetical protein